MYLIAVADASRCDKHNVLFLRKLTVTYTYSNKPRAKRRIHRKIPGLREPRALALQPTAILVAKVRVHEDAELGLGDEKRRERAPQVRERLEREDEGLEEDIVAQADDAAVAQRRHGHC